MSVVIKDIEILRKSRNGRWTVLCIAVGTNLQSNYFQYCNESNRNENEVISDLLDDFVREFNFLECFKTKILQGFNQLQQNDFSGNSWELMQISLVPQKSHFSCNKDDGENLHTNESEETEISQSEVLRKLAIVNKDSKVQICFEENRCSVCLSNYKDLLEENLHIVVSSCGHPLCCKCADTILQNANKECPRCRGSINAECRTITFNLAMNQIEMKMKLYQICWMIF